MSATTTSRRALSAIVILQTNMKSLLLATSLLVFQIALCQRYTLVADKLIDCKRNKVIERPVVIVENGKIVDVLTGSAKIDSSILIDLTGFTLLPGLMDMHTHLLINGGEFANDLYENSSVYRSLRAVNHLNISLQNGFTTIRDLGTEGAGFSDVDISRSIDSGFIVGPRIFPAGRGIAATGSYLPRPRKQNWEFDLPAGTQYVSGIAECLKAVREQENKNVKWIKLFSDWGYDPTFSREEIQAMLEDARRYPLPVAAHAKSKQGIRNSIIYGARSIEHGDQFDDSLIQLAIKHNVYWCPTLSWEIFYGRVAPGKYEMLNRAYKQGLKIVCGTDVGGYPWTVKQATELEYYVKKAGMTNMDAIKTATIHAAEMIGMSNELGSVEKNYIADIIAVKGDPTINIEALQQVVFVMRQGIIYKTPRSK
jgi:imidazolonepropionase-like amidohydrolase